MFKSKMTAVGFTRLPPPLCILGLKDSFLFQFLACTLGNLKPKENEDKLVEMLNCAPGKAIQLSEVFGMDDCFISRLERYWQDKKDIGSDVLHFLATKCPKLTVNDICVLLCEKDTSRIVQLATELQAKTEE